MRALFATFGFAVALTASAAFAQPEEPTCRDDADCPAGNHCDNARCTFDCREDGDCGMGRSCNTFGRCGCSATPGPLAAVPGALWLAIPFALALRMRR